MERTIDRSLERAAALRRGEPFLFFEGKTVRYGVFVDRVARTAGGLERAGVRAGDRVALLLGNVPEFAEAVFALLRLGAVIVPINQFLAPPEIARLIKRAGPASIVAGEEMLPLLSDAPSLERGLFVVGREKRGDHRRFEDLGRGEALSEAVPRPAPETTALLLFTSGTEGEPRGVLLSHGNLCANARQCVEALETGPEDRFLLFLPLFHTFTLTVCLFLPAMLGASIVMVRSARNFPAMMRQAVLFRRVTVFVAVPAVYNALARKRIPFLVRKLHSIRMMVSGSAPLTTQTIAAVEAKFGAPLLEGYGLTEAGPVVSVNRPAKRLAGTVGLPLPGIDVRVVGRKGEERMPGEVGELLVRGENVADRYLGDDSPVENGWLRTGDLASLNEDGFITIHDRKKDVILVRGINVYPREIEEAITEHPAVAGAAVVRALSERKGEVPRAFVVPSEGMTLTPATILGHLRGKLAPYKIPAYVEIVSDLPRGGTGKILRRVLEERPLPGGAPGSA
ncbi:MAG: AMP-binding protein [Candidatus Eisenbacteria bacterium]